MSAVDPNKIINAYANWKTREGWVLVNRTSEGAQFSIPRRYSPLAFWIGLFTFWIYGFGILIWTLGAIDYIFSDKSAFYVDVYQMERETRERRQ